MTINTNLPPPWPFSSATLRASSTPLLFTLPSLTLRVSLKSQHHLSTLLCHNVTSNIKTLRNIHQGPQPVFTNSCQNHPPKVMPQNPCSTARNTTHTMLPSQGSWKTGNMKTKIRAICTNITSICVVRCASITSLDWTPARGENCKVWGIKVVMMVVVIRLDGGVDAGDKWKKIHHLMEAIAGSTLPRPPEGITLQDYMRALFPTQVPHGKIYRLVQVTSSEGISLASHTRGCLIQKLPDVDIDGLCR